MLKSFGYAVSGLIAVVKSEQNFRVHLVSAVLAIALGFGLGISGAEWGLIIACIAAVMGAETMNTAIEKLCDVVSPQYHDKIKTVKDLAAAAVLIVSIGALITGGIIFIPRIIHQLSAF
ncbi:diacylglycerol kinase family protein [Niabella sp. CJ426]|uniref:diacylglycerol kinase family protein n=1 Tax=Niabella sp. CJ426 TaxID=3393740 RepID=UPI003D092506